MKTVCVMVILVVHTVVLAQWTSLDLRINDFVYDDSRELMYATIQQSQPGIGNSIAVIDPLVPQILSTTPVPGEPVKLALSSTSNTVFFGLDSQARIGSYDVGSANYLGSFSLGSHKSGEALGPTTLRWFQVQKVQLLSLVRTVQIHTVVSSSIVPA